MLTKQDPFLQVKESIDSLFESVDAYQQLFNISRSEAEHEVDTYGQYKKRAIRGNKALREWIIGQYAIIIKHLFKVDHDGMNEFINFSQLQSNPCDVLFEMLLEIYDITDILALFLEADRLTEANIRDLVKEKEDDIQAYYVLNKKIRLLAVLIYRKEYGQDIIDTLQHHKMNEIGFTRKNYVYVVYNGRKVYLEFLRFDSKGILENICQKTTGNAKEDFQRSNIIVIANKDNGNRITATGYDMTPTEEDFYYNERVFNLKKVTLEELQHSFKTINPLIYQLLVTNQKGRGSALITGSDMGIGKSTLLAALIEKIRDREGIGIVDVTNELQAHVKYPWKNIITVLENSKKTLEEVFEYLLKTSRDVLVVGEINRPKEVALLVDASLRLNAGVSGTFFSLSPYEVVTNLRNLMMRTEMYHNADVAEADIARGIDLIIHMARHQRDKKRIIVESIVEIEYIQQDHPVEMFLGDQFSAKKKIGNLLDMAQLAIGKYLYKKNYRYNPLIAYDYDKEDWALMQMPSSAYFNKLAIHLGTKEVDAFKALWVKEKEVIR